MDLVLSGLSYRSCMVYSDDVIVFGHSFDETMDRLEKVFKRLQRARLKLKSSKCSLLRRIRNSHCHARRQNRCHSGLAFVPKHHWSPNIHGTQGILQTFHQGLFHYRFSAVRIDEKEYGVRVDQTIPRHVRWVKNRLMAGPILALPKNKGCFVLDTDASDFGLGAVLSQRQIEAPAEAPASKPDRKLRVSQSKDRVIAYGSKAESKYEMTQKELFAMVFSLKQ